MTPQEAHQKASQYLKKLLHKNRSCPILEGKLRKPSSPLTRAAAIAILETPVEYIAKNLHRSFLKLDTLADIIRQDNTQPPDFLLPPYGQEEQNPIDQKLAELEFTVYQRGVLNIPTILDKLAQQIACGNFPRDIADGSEGQTKVMPTGRRIVETITTFPTPKGTQWDKVVIRFIANDLIQIVTGDVSKKYTFAEIGFKDGRKGNQPDAMWATLKILAQFNGQLSWTDKTTSGQRNKYKKHIQIIKKRLKQFMQIDDDPFFPYKNSQSYQTKFLLSFPQD